ncbi:MAG: macrolide ABC transporter ATP-binding protein [Deltaproteobacteria bacterium HGW-Deltaproteobacteria-20]|nr:MAG: macrolide ABC transporter ATP-binding protein [Deltaproteobacteria bacterium HGW-Deltaproteobacteria-20]
MAEVVRAEGLRRAFGQGDARRVAVDAVSLTVTAGEFLTVFGPSGSGKSTLLGIVGTLDRGFEGQLHLDGRDVRGMSDRELSRLRGERIGFVFQAFYLLDHLTVIENVTVPFLFTPRSRPRRTALRALQRVGLEDRAKDLTAGLSGGQRQRVAIARAIVHAPALLLCDEPTGNLDADTAAQIIDIFASLHRDDGVTVLCATHDERIAKVATRTVRMRDGRLEAQTDEVGRADA